ncbi:MAG: PepSY domain-containing protein [Nitrospira sp.]|nr:PepSY domain-containing protein [Nitrospira sp.]
MHTRTSIAAGVLALSLLSAPAWAMFESNKTLAASATITLEDAVRKALTAVPGKAVEAEIGKEDGRVCYEVEIVDRNNNTQKVYVDAQTGQAKIDK